MSTAQPVHVRIVGIGASAGGIPVLQQFFDALPSDTGLAFVVIQHLDPSQSSQMAAILSRSTAMKVAQAEDGARAEADHVYTIPPGKFLFTKDGKLCLTDPVTSNGLRMPIDFFFRSLAEAQRESAIAVLFCGNGSDGTLGIREIHGNGGLVLVQDPKTTQFDSMIEHALATGMVDHALPVREIPGVLLRCVQQDGAVRANPPDSSALKDGIASIVNLLASENKGDFRFYKSATIERRIQRRMGLNQIPDMPSYYQFLAEQPAELAKLAQDLLIGVTSFFRDPEAFEELRDKVVAPLIRQKNNGGDPLRVWVAGCATGEEAYSIVILFMEEMARQRKRLRLQMFASDIDAEALRRARDGLYSESIAADVSEERLSRFFIKQDGFYRAHKEIRESITFALHNIISDPPFFHMDLISCRNMLIYIEPEFQKKIINRIAFALKPDSYLFLGKSENPMDQSDLFEPIAKNMRVFRRNSTSALPIANFQPRMGVSHGSSAAKAPTIRLSDLNQQVLLKHFNASIVLIDEDGEIRHFYGPTHRYLSHSFGKASLSLFDMVDSRHAPMLRLAAERSAKTGESVRLEALEFGADAPIDSVTITVMPFVGTDSGARLFAVIFEDTAKSPSYAQVAMPSRHEIENENDTLLARLEAENKALRAEIQANSDAFQTVHEELTAANEEVNAINEELQSTNEELVTSKEELQSVNEELITTNGQLNDRVGELGRVNDDLANLLNATDISIVFLDRKLCVRRFTPSVKEIMNLLPVDVGRPLSHISHKFKDIDLAAIAENVLKTLIPVQTEVATLDGFWRILRCLPYRSLKDTIDGIVFTFSDVTKLKRSEEALREAKLYAENIIQTTREALLVLDSELRVVSANDAFYDVFRVKPEDTRGRIIFELGNRQWDIARLRELLEQIIPHDSMVQDFEVKHNFPNIGPKIMMLNARRIHDPKGGATQLILLAINDITAIEARSRLAALVESSQDAIIGLALDGTITSWNTGAERIFDYRAAEMIGQSIMRIVPPGRHQEEEKEILRRLQRGERIEHFDTLRLARDGRLVNISLTISPIKDGKGTVVGASKVARDVTEQKRLEQQRQELSRELEKQVFERTAELREANRKLLQDISERERLEEQLRQSHKLESMGTLAAGIAHDLNNLLNIIQGYASILAPGATRDEISESVEAITQTTRRGATLVQQLLALARKTETKIELLELNGLIEQLSTLIKGTFPKNIEIRLELSRSPLTVMGDASQINQVLLNLCVNARDAMPNGGPLVLKTLTVDAKDLEAHGEFASAKFAVIEVMDGGVGIDEKTQQHIFDPFFTTKPVGQGTGLGLAVVYGIVKSHGGFIHVESQPGHGATFTLYFPITSPGG